LTIFHKWTWRGGGNVRVGWDGGVRRVRRVGKCGGVEGGGGVGGREGCFTREDFFTGFLYILLKPKNKIKVVFNSVCGRYFSTNSSSFFYSAYDFFCYNSD
jgi:hypothetical protein